MTELFIIQYILVTIVAFMLTEKHPPSYMWKNCDKATRFVGCMIPIYREIMMLIILWNRK
jgi:hypothetical protein